MRCIRNRPFFLEVICALELGDKSPENPLGEDDFHEMHSQ